MKKRNRVLEILACTALTAVVFLGYMFTAQDNGRFEIEDIAGDRAHRQISPLKVLPEMRPVRCIISGRTVNCIQSIMQALQIR